MTPTRDFEAIDPEWVRTRSRELFDTLTLAHLYGSPVFALVVDELEGRKSELSRLICKVGPDKRKVSPIALPAQSWIAKVKPGRHIGDTGYAVLNKGAARLAKHIQTRITNQLCVNRFELADGIDGYYEMRIPDAPKSGVYKSAKVFFPKCWFKEICHEAV